MRSTRYIPELGASKYTSMAKTLLDRHDMQIDSESVMLGVSISVSNMVDWYMTCVATGHIVVSQTTNNDRKICTTYIRWYYVIIIGKLKQSFKSKMEETYTGYFSTTLIP
jgi:hypothetical protein